MGAGCQPKQGALPAVIQGESWQQDGPETEGLLHWVGDRSQRWGSPSFGVGGRVTLGQHNFMSAATLPSPHPTSRDPSWGQGEERLQLPLALCLSSHSRAKQLQALGFVLPSMAKCPPWVTVGWWDQKPKCRTPLGTVSAVTSARPIFKS